MNNGPRDPQRRASWRRERAEVARQLHPDLGGDGDALIAELARVDARYADPAVTAQGGVWVGVRRRMNRQVRRSRRGLRLLRSRLPRQVPGSRRYIDL